MTNITEYEKFVQVRHFAQYVINEAGKGQTIAALVEDFNTTAEVNGFSDLMIVKPGRVAKLVEAMELVLKRLDAMPEYAERVPEVSDKQAAEHLVHALWLKGQLLAHGIDPQDFDAALAWNVGNGNIVPRYWISIYVDYVYQVTPFCPDEGCPHSDTVHYCNTPLVMVVNSQQAESLRIQGYSGDLSVVDVMPGMVDTAEVCAKSFPSLSDEWRPMTDQEARAAFNYQDQLKLNNLPRGKCAKRMLTLGWHFNED